MKTNTTSTELKTDSSKMPLPPDTSGYVKPVEEVKPDETPEVDELGYDIPKPEEKIETPEVAPVVEDNKEVITKATGYGEEDPEEIDDKKPVENKVETPEDQKTDEQKAAETLEKDIVESLGNLPDGFDKDSIKEFAIENKMSKSQVDNYVAMVKADSDKNAADQKQASADQRKAWGDDLKNDPEFGGENLVKNLDASEKILDKYFGEYKKRLTDSKGMVPPYVMKGFLRLYNLVNPTSGLETGEAPRVEEKEINDLDAMYE